MANLPFSGLVAATTALAADLICISQGGVSKKSTRPIFLTAQPGEAIGLHRSAGTGAIILDATGSIFLNTDAAGQLQVNVNGAVLQISALGQLTMYAAGGQILQLGGGNDYIQLNDAGMQVLIAAVTDINLNSGSGAQVIDIPSAGPITITFADTGGNFAGGVTDLLVAVTRIAAQVKILSGGVPIP